MASVFRRGIANEKLDDDEAIQFLVLLGHYLNTWSVLYDLYREKQLPETQWVVIKKDIISLLATTGGTAFWNDVGRLGVSDAFVIEIDNLIKSQETSYNIT